MGDHLSQEEIDRLLGKAEDDHEEEEEQEDYGVESWEEEGEEGLLVEKARFKPLSPVESSGEKRDIQEFSGMFLNLSVELGKTTLTIRDVLSLKESSIIQLEKMAGDNVNVLVNNCYFAQGEIVVINDSFGLRITTL